MRLNVSALMVGVLIMFLGAVAMAEESKDSIERGRSSKSIALTYDDGPSEQVTPALLDVLSTYRAHATFFPLGSKIQANSALIKRMAAQGHAIGNHTLSHERLTGLSVKSVQEEIEGVNAQIREITGQAPTLFRPPYGAVNEPVITIARANGLAIVLWSLYPEKFGDSLRGADAIGERVIPAARDCDIVFMHDTAMQSVNASEMIVWGLSAKGFEFVTVAELIHRCGRFTPGETYRTGRGAE